MRLPALAVVVFALSASAAPLPCREASLGVDTTNVTSALRTSRNIPGYVAGALVRVVRVGGPAARAGIHEGDVIQALDTDLLQNVCDLRGAIARRGCTQVRLTVRRGSDTLKFDIPLTDAARFPQKRLDPQNACRAGDGAGCTALARANNDAVDLLRLGCDYGDSAGCFLLALKLGNTKEGAIAYEEACDGGNVLACTNLGWMFEHGKGAAVNLEAAARLYRRGCAGSRCTGSNTLGCVNLGRLYRDGVGVKKDEREAFRLFRSACDREPRDDEERTDIARACSLAGTILMFGTTLEHDSPLALKLLEKGCTAADTFGCYNLGVIYEGLENRKRAATYYQRACDGGDAEACQRVAVLDRLRLHD